MDQIKLHILCTRPLNAVLLEEAAASNITIDELSFIETEPILSVEVQQEIELALTEMTTVVFTSMNAVEAVATFAEEQPAWRIYSIGTTTQKLVRKYFGEHSIAGTANDAADLAELIVEDGEAENVIFFCGDQRRDDLPGILQNNDIEVNEIVVYQTIAINHKVDKDYNGILFFSPSAVNSFFKKNKPTTTTILFAIGNTTANEIKKYSNNKIIVSNQPGKDNLVKTMIDYFT